MTGPPIDQVRDACTRLAGYLQALELLVTEPSSGNAVPGIPQPRPHQPLPGDQAAFYALMNGLEALRRLETALLRAKAEDWEPWALDDLLRLCQPRRGMSEENTVIATTAVPRLAAGLDEDWEATVALYLEKRIWECQTVRAIDEVTRYRPLPRGGGGLPSACPHCESVTLRAVLGPDGRLTGQVECHTWGCRDDNGWQPVAAMGTDEHGRPCLVWADGITVLAPELGPA